MTVRIENLLTGKVTIPTFNRKLYQRILRNWDQIAKPLRSFGRLEEIHARIGAIQGQELPDFERIELLVCCADHGIVEEGVSQSDQSITAICAENIGRGQSTAGILATAAGARITAIDVGMNQSNPVPGTLDCRVAQGTGNFLREPAMTQGEFRQALQVGLDLARDSKQRGITLLGIGEMGIGNTTSAAVLTGKFLHRTADDVLGPGAGLSQEGRLRKKKVIEQALSMEVPDDTESIFCAFGGLELAAMSGIILGGALYGIPVILDGMLSQVSALAAERLVIGVKDYIIPSHRSKEPASQALCQALNLEPVIHGNMAAGEGTGAALMMSLLKPIDQVYRKAKHFEGYGMEPYEHYERSPEE